MDQEKNKRYVRSVCKAGGVIGTIAKIGCIIGAVALVVGILLLSFLPAGAMKVEMSTGTRVFLAESLLRYAADEESFALLVGEAEKESLTVEKTEGGYAFEGDPTVVELENRTVAIAILPTLVKLAATAVFFHFLARAFKKEAEGFLLFDRGAAADLKLAGTSLWILFGAPIVTSSLVEMITGASPSADSSLFLVFWGFALHAIARLMEYGATVEEQSFAAP